jgi:hypothetical protein
MNSLDKFGQHIELNQNPFTEPNYTINVIKHLHDTKANGGLDVHVSARGKTWRLVSVWPDDTKLQDLLILRH